MKVLVIFDHPRRASFCGAVLDAFVKGLEEAGTECACEPGQTLLQTARRANVRILSVCEMGLCGTCKVMKLSGKVAIEHNGGITDEEIQEGYVLACYSKPTSTVVIEA